MSLQQIHENTKVQLGKRTFWVPVQRTSKKENVQRTDKQWLEELNKKQEKANAEIENCAISSSDSESDDELYNYWIKDEPIETEKPKEEPKKAPVVPEKPKIEKKVEIENLKNENSKPRFTHFLHFPLYSSETFARRCANFKKDAVKAEPHLQPFSDIGKPHLTILPLALSDFQLDITNQVLDNLLASNPEIRPESRSKNSQKLKLNINGIGFFGRKNDAKNAKVVWAKVDKDKEFDRMEKIINAVISKLIELGVVNESQMDHARFDISEMKYKLEQPHITLMKSRKEPFDAVGLLRQFGEFNFGYSDVETIELSKMDKDYTVVKSVRLW